VSTSSLNAPDIRYQVDGAALWDPEGFLDRATDIPGAAWRHRIPLEAAGIMDQQISLRLLDLAGPPDGLRLNGTVSATAMLDGDHRGVHMSRIVEAVIAAEGQVWSSLSDAVEELAAAGSRGRAGA
jgi:GTP cyclohydrolase FolE2